MPESGSTALGVAAVIAWIIAGYAACGLAVGGAFVMSGVDHVDTAVHGAPRIFRAVILPGAAAFWPWVLFRWIRANRLGGP